MLADENRIAVRVDDEKATAAGPVLIDFAEELHTQRLQMKLYLANAGARFERFWVAIQPGWKVSVFFLNMPPELPDHVITALEYQPHPPAP